MKKQFKAAFAVDKRDSLGTTLLMEAARRGTYDRLLKCLGEGSDINAVDYAGRNALMYAIEGKHDGLATVLIARGIDAERKDANKNTPLIQACIAGVPEIIERLMQKHVTLDAQNDKGNTALMMACTAGDGWAACKLVDAGADFETLKNSKGTDALTLARAALRGDDLVKFLACVDKSRERQQAANIAAAETKARELAQNVEVATVLQRNVTPLRPVAFRPKAP